MTINASKLRSLSTDALVDLFAESAKSRTVAMNALKPKLGNKHFDMMTDIYTELKSRGLPAQQSLSSLLTHPDSDVRCNAATLILEFAPSQAEPVLKSLAQLHGFVAFEAKLALEGWEQGDLEFPPYKKDSR
jgi:Domain of unknown function (DUF2019)